MQGANLTGVAGILAILAMLTFLGWKEGRDAVFGLRTFAKVLGWTSLTLAYFGLFLIFQGQDASGSSYMQMINAFGVMVIFFILSVIGRLNKWGQPMDPIKVGVIVAFWISLLTSAFCLVAFLAWSVDWNNEKNTAVAAGILGGLGLTGLIAMMSFVSFKNEKEVELDDSSLIPEDLV